MTTVDEFEARIFEAAREYTLARLADIALRQIMQDARAIVASEMARFDRLWRARAEARALRGMIDRAAPPVQMAAAPIAPARGAMQLVANVLILPGGHVYRDGATHWRGMDALSIMCRKAFERHKGDADSFVPPFTNSQIDMARHYAALVERHEAAGMKCASLEGRSGAGGDGTAFIVAVLEDREEIAALRRRVGSGWALEVARATKRRRVPLTVMELVDRVCLHGETISEILEACGWTAYRETRIWAREKLAEALDRMSVTAR